MWVWFFSPEEILTANISDDQKGVCLVFNLFGQRVDLLIDAAVWKTATVVCVKQRAEITFF